MFQDDTTGLRFGNFEVLVRPDGSVHELGRGGFGRTLLARHSLLDTEVALKLIDERHALNEAARARFLKEAKEQARLTHPGIARITDCGIVDGQLYYAVELCTGGHLKEYVAATGPLNVADTFHILTQAAEALEYSHRRGVVHLDVKPSNLMLVFDEEGVPHVKLIDFGLVQRTTAEAPTGVDGQPLFSPAFASPEQIRALPTEPRSDLFSLGMTGWYLLTGKNPIEGAADTVIRERLTPTEYESLLPAQLSGKPRSVLARLIRKNAADRYASGVELLADLRACLQTMPPLGGGWQRRQRSSGILADRFILEKGTPSRMGMVHPALDKESRQRVKVTMLRRGTPPPVILQYQKAAEALRDSEGNGLVRVLEVREFNEGWAVVEEASSGVSLTEILRREGALPLGRYAPLVWQLGHAMDTAFSAGLTSVVLEEAMVELPPAAAGKTIDWSLVTLMVPVSLAIQEHAPSPDADVTRTGEFTLTTTSTVGGVQLLARWVYFITGGKNPPPSSLYSIKEYVNIPTLSEQANQIVARHLCGQSTTPRCEEMLRQIFAAEGLSWDVVGDRVRGSRWNVLVLQAAAAMQDIEQSVASAEKVANACTPLAEARPDEVRECYAAVSAVYEAATAARTRQEQLSQGNRELKTGRAAVAALEDLSRKAHKHFEEAEAAFRALKDAAEKQNRAADLRQRRHRELMEAITGACRRTEAAAQEAREIAGECRRVAPSASAARQMESLAEQTGALAGQLATLRNEAAAAPESEWSRLESQLPRSRQVAADADEMARTCHSLLDKAKAEARRREEEAKVEARRREDEAKVEAHRREEEHKARAVAAAALATIIRQVEQTALEAPAILAEIRTLAGSLPALAEAERRAADDAARAAEVVGNMQSLRSRNDDSAPQEAAIAADDVSRLVDGMRQTMDHARQAFAEEEKLAEAARAAAVSLRQISAAAMKSAAAAAQQLAGHGLAAPPGTPAAASLEKAAAAGAAALQCQEEIATLAGTLTSRRSESDRFVEQARTVAAAGERHASETVRHLRDAAQWLAEAERQAHIEAENVRARAAAAIAGVVGQVEREVKRTRDAFMRAGQHADIPAATAAVADASAAWSACQERHRAIRHWQKARPLEAASDADFLERLAAEQRTLSVLADSVEKAAGAAAAAAGEAAREAEERQRQELEARRRKEEEERHRREEEARRFAAEAQLKRQAELAEQRRREEEARRIAEAQEGKRQEELSEQRRREEEARHIAEAELAEQRRIAGAEAAERRRIEEAARQKAETEAAERRRLEEEARRKVEAEAAEQRRQEEEAKRQAETEETRRQAEVAARRRQEAETKRQAVAEEKRRLDAEEKQRQAEAAALRKEEAEAKRQAEAEEKRCQTELSAKQKQEAEARRKAEAEEKRGREAEEKQKQAEAAKLKQEAEAARKAEVAGKRRQEAEEKRTQAEAAKLQQQADAKLKSEAEEKRRQVEVAAQLRIAAEEKHPEPKRQAEPKGVTPAPVQAAETAKAARSKAPLIAAAAVVVIGGAAAGWWAMRDKAGGGANRPDNSKNVTAVTPPTVDPPIVPAPPPPPVIHTIAIKLAGDAVTSGLIAAKDIKLRGHDATSLTTTADSFSLKVQEGSPPLSVTLSGVPQGFKLEPATLSISSAADGQHTVTVTREAGRVVFHKPSAESASFYTYAILTWKGTAEFAPPGETERTLSEDTDIPTGAWSVVLDDDEPADAKPGKSGLIVDRRPAGTLEIKSAQKVPLALPPGLPALLYSVVEWQTQANSAEEKQQESLMRKMLQKNGLPADDDAVQEVVAGLARTLARPAHSYPLCLVRRDSRFFVLRPQRRKFSALLTLGTDRLAMTAGIAKLVDLPVDLRKLNPAVSVTGVVPWSAVKDCLLTARNAIAGSKIGKEPDALTLIAEIDSSLDILRISTDNNWTVPPQEITTFAATWDDITEPCSEVRVSANGTVSLGFAMNEKSRRELVIGPRSDGRFPVQMPAGPADDEKDTFTGSFTPLPSLPAALAGKVPP